MTNYNLHLFLRSRKGLVQFSGPGASPPEHRFWARVNKRGPNHPICGVCWLWEGTRSDEYGQLMVHSKIQLAHRYSWELHNGTIDGCLLVCHRCDNPACVNPDHLFLGSDEDNSKDKRDKGREVVLKGESNGNAILTDDRVRYIRKVYRAKSKRFGAKALARLYGVGQHTIQSVAHGNTWRHVV